MEALKFTSYMVEVFNRQIRTHYKDVTIEKICDKYNYILHVTRHDDTCVSHCDYRILFYNSETKLMEYCDEIKDYRPYNQIIKLAEQISSKYYPTSLETHNFTECIAVRDKVELARNIKFNSPVLIAYDLNKVINLDKAKMEVRTNDKDIVTFEYSLTGIVDDRSFNHVTVEDVIYSSNFMDLFIDDFIDRYIINVGTLTNSDHVASMISRDYVSELAVGERSYTTKLPEGVVIGKPATGSCESNNLHVFGVGNGIFITCNGIVNDITYDIVFNTLNEFLFKNCSFNY